MPKKPQGKDPKRNGIEEECEEYDEEMENSDCVLQNNDRELGNKCKKDCECTELLFSVGDAIFASIVVAPLVVANWRGTWELMDLHQHYFPYAQSYILGMTIHICFSLMR